MPLHHQLEMLTASSSRIEMVLSCQELGGDPVAMAWHAAWLVAHTAQSASYASGSSAGSTCYAVCELCQACLSFRALQGAAADRMLHDHQM